MYTINSSSLIPVSSLWCHHTPGDFRGLRPLSGEAFPVVGKRNWFSPLRERTKSLKWLRCSLASFDLFCCEEIYAPFTELSKASVNFVHASCGCGASVWATASYAEQSQISACMKFGNEACSVNGAYIHRKQTTNPYHNNYSLFSRIFFISSASSLYFQVT